MIWLRKSKSGINSWFLRAATLCENEHLHLKVVSFSLFRSSFSQMFFKIGVLKNFAIITGNHPCWRLFLIKLQVWRYSNTGVFLWILWNFLEKLFYKTPPVAAAIHFIFTRKIRTEKFCSVFFLTKKNVSFIDLYIVSSSLVSSDDLLFI